MDAIASEGYLLKEQLGCGTFGVVYRALKRASQNKSVAIKTIRKIDLSARKIENIVSEIRLQKELHHPHTVQLLDFFYDANNVYIVMEYCDGGSLAAYIRQHRQLPEKNCQIILQQLGLAMRYMRSKNISHFDIKPANLLLSKIPVLQLKVADFGLAQILLHDQRTTKLRGTPHYMAPEILCTQVYGPKADLWSTGIVLYECLFKSDPFVGLTLEKIQKIMIEMRPINIPPSPRISNDCRDLLTKLLTFKPEERISFEQFFAHSFLDIQHAPTSENLARAADLIKLALEQEQAKEFNAAFASYHEALRYYVPFCYIQTNAADKAKLCRRLHSYVDRAESVNKLAKRQTMAAEMATAKQSDASNPEAVQHASKQHYSELVSLCASTPSLKSTLEIGHIGEMYYHEGKMALALEQLTTTIEMVIKALSDEPKGRRRVLLHEQAVKWLTIAETIKKTLPQTILDEIASTQTNSPYNCVIQ